MFPEFVDSVRIVADVAFVWCLLETVILIVVSDILEQHAELGALRVDGVLPGGCDSLSEQADRVDHAPIVGFGVVVFLNQSLLLVLDVGEQLRGPIELRVVPDLIKLC